MLVCVLLTAAIIICRLSFRFSVSVF